MTPTYAAAPAIVVPCDTPTCTAYLTLPPDSPLPRDPWFCPACEDHIAEQQHDAQLQDMARYFGQQENDDANAR